MQKKAIIMLHLFTWLLTAFVNLPYLTMNHLSDPKFLLTYLMAVVYLMVCFYFFYLVMVPYLLRKKRLPFFLLFSAITVFILPFFGYSILYAIKATFEGVPYDFIQAYSLSVHLKGMIPLVIIAAFGSFFRLIIDWFDLINKKEIAENKRLTSEMALLKSKINPHFLFNTLNNIDALIHENSEEASKALLKLSEIMRYMTYETTSERIDLKHEIHYIHNLLELYRLRVSNPELITLNVDVNRQDLKIAPLLFIPFIENAIKFTTFRNESIGIRICLKETNGKIFFKIINSYSPESVTLKKSNSGLGMVNIRKRLNLTYPGKHHLLIDKTVKLYKVQLTLDTNAD